MLYAALKQFLSLLCPLLGRVKGSEVFDSGERWSSELTLFGVEHSIRVFRFNLVLDADFTELNAFRFFTLQLLTQVWVVQVTQ